MEISNEIFNKLVVMINDAKKDKNYEFEARFWNKKKNLINEENYTKIFQKLTFSKENNGLGYNYTMKNILDIFLKKSSFSDDYENLRISINNTNDIKKYWITSNLENLETSFIEKEKIDKIDESNYNIRFSLNNELPQTDILEKNKNLILSNEHEKVFRLKNRYSIKTDDNLFLIDMSITKMGFGNSFKKSNTLKENPKYEIEIEYIGGDNIIDSNAIIKKLLSYCEIIIKLLQNSNIILTNNLIEDIKENYNKLVNNKINNYFIAASPVTIHIEHLFKNDNINIYNRYAVTLKADGERNFLIVHKSNIDAENGKIFIFNNNFDFVDTGYKDVEWTNTLIEGEYIDNNGHKELLMYDILFSKGEDVRRRHLIDISKESKNKTRLQILDDFSKSNNRKVIELFNEEKCIKLKTKKYIQSIRNDGSDIFQKIKEIWDTKKYNSFNIDGIILVPKYDYYPLRGGSWSSLLKWKPPELNTIDFLIKVIKDDDKKDIKNPLITIINRPDGKQETVLKQYKTIQLYVTGQKTVYNMNNKTSANANANASASANAKTYKKKIPVLFNPFNMDNKNNELYNNAKIIIEDDEKMYAIDNITNEKTEIYDDIIVEFGYDSTKEDGFRWIPHRFRKDKTNLYKSGEDMYGNSEYTANDIFRAINLPITEEMITTGNIPVVQDKDTLNQKPYYIRTVGNNGKTERFPFQNFHNHYIKYQLLYFSSPSYIHEFVSGTRGKLLDLCCGRGVDINKIKRARYAEIVGMDIDYKNIKDAQEWYKNMIPSPKPKAYYVRGDSKKLIWPEQSCAFTEADKIYTKKFIPSKYLFDTVSLQFCFHYFFEDEISFRSILQNINDNLKIGGFVIGTTFDGERVYEQLQNKEFITGTTFSGETMWKIEKKYSDKKLVFTNKKAIFGKKIDVFLKTIGNIHTEYLVNFKYLDKIMEEYGFSKISVKPFEDFYNELIEGKSIMDLTDKELEKDMESVKKMSEEEKRFSFLSSGFIYKKERNSSDSLTKKLVELMEKKDKLRKKENVYKVDEDTEHTIQNLEESGIL
jgi:SAM-dependent methyltransferase